jgi:hypothetical protein
LGNADERKEGTALAKAHRATRVIIALGALFSSALIFPFTFQSDEEIPAFGFNHPKSERLAGRELRHLDWHGLADLDLMRTGGASYYRAYFRLDQVDKNDDGLLDDWQLLDNLVRQAALRHVTVLPVLIRTRVTTGGGVTFRPPTTRRNQARFARFARAAALRYGLNGTLWRSCFCPTYPIRVWELWTKENIAPYWPQPDPVRYGFVLRQVRTALRSVDPGARVLLGGLAFRGDRYWPPAEFLRIVIEREGTRAVEAVAVHLVDDVAVPLAVKRVQSVVEALKRYAGHSKGAPRQQIWITELGWAGIDHDSEQLQHLRLMRILGEFDSRRAAWNLGPVFWTSLRDSPGGSSGSEMGLRRTRRDGSDRGPKPAWHDYAAFGRSSRRLPLPIVR